jgi:DNA polymerase-3 subunit delta'
MKAAPSPLQDSPQSPWENPWLIGLEQPLAQLQQALDQHRLAGSWLLTGEMGVGKTTLAVRLARFLLAGAPSAPQLGAAPPAFNTIAAEPNLFGLLTEAPPPPPSVDEPAGLAAEDPFFLSPAHPVFQQAANQAHPDLLLITPELTGAAARPSIAVDQVRRINDFLRLAAGHDGWRVVVIDQAHSMTRQAQNALLKLLEEPPPQTLITLSCSLPNQLLPTVRSRCRRLHCPNLSAAQVQQGLAQLYPQLPPLPPELQLSFRLNSIGRAASFLKNLWPAYQSLLALLQKSAAPNLHLLQQWRKSLNSLKTENSALLEAEVFTLFLQRLVRAKVQESDDQPHHFTADETAVFAKLEKDRNLTGYALSQRQALLSRWLGRAYNSHLDPTLISWQSLNILMGSGDVGNMLMGNK